MVDPEWGCSNLRQEWFPDAGYFDEGAAQVKRLLDRDRKELANETKPRAEYENEFDMAEDSGRNGSKAASTSQSSAYSDGAAEASSSNYYLTKLWLFYESNIWNDRAELSPQYSDKSHTGSLRKLHVATSPNVFAIGVLSSFMTTYYILDSSTPTPVNYKYAK